MTQENKDFKADKISLIYEFNNSSPLFVRVAQTCLVRMEVDEAISILEKGLETYPNYPSAYIVYSKALAIKGDNTKAVEILTKGSELINSKSTLDYYLKEIEKISVEYSGYIGSVGEDFVPGKLTDEDIAKVEDTVDNFKFTDLEKLTEKVSKAKMPRVSGMVEIDNESEFEFDENKIISETLAGIYFAQGNYEEAIELYNELKIQNPGRAGLFDQRISEIEELIRNNNN